MFQNVNIFFLTLKLIVRENDRAKYHLRQDGLLLPDAQSLHFNFLFLLLFSDKTVEYFNTFMLYTQLPVSYTHLTLPTKLEV